MGTAQQFNSEESIKVGSSFSKEQNGGSGAMDDRTALLDEFIGAHIAYIQDIYDKISANNVNDTDADNACRDNLCKIGLWLESMAQDLGEDPLDLQICTTHSRFHNNISNIMREHINGNREKALDALDNILAVHGGCFHDMRTTLTLFLRRMDNKTLQAFQPRPPVRGSHQGPAGDTRNR